MNFGELLILAAELGLHVKPSTVFLSGYIGGPIGEVEHIQSEAIAFVLAHEIVHATGAHHRLNRRAISTSRTKANWWLSHASCTLVRTEEEIADRVAIYLTGSSRNESVTHLGIGSYPPVTPLTRSEHYVNVKAFEVIEYLMPYIQQIQERKAA